MSRLFSLLKIAALLCIAGLLVVTVEQRGHAASIAISNPTFDVTVDHTFVDNGNTYLGGSLLPTGYYVAALGSSTIFSLASGNPPTSGTGTFIGSGTLTGWNFVGDIGRIGVIASNVLTSGSLNAGPAGFFTAIAGGGFTGTGGFMQTVPGSVLFQPFTTYVLTVDLLDKGLPVTPTITADLTAGGTRVNGAQVILTPTQSALGRDTVTFTTGASVPSGLLGILLEGTDTEDGHLSQILFDNVTLATVPEPSTAVLCTLGAAGLAIAAVRRRRA